jgi:hypothetical protein
MLRGLPVKMMAETICDIKICNDYKIFGYNNHSLERRKLSIAATCEGGGLK